MRDPRWRQTAWGVVRPARSLRSHLAFMRLSVANVPPAPIRRVGVLYVVYETLLAKVVRGRRVGLNERGALILIMTDSVKYVSTPLVQGCMAERVQKRIDREMFLCVRAKRAYPRLGVNGACGVIRLKLVACRWLVMFQH